MTFEDYELSLNLDLEQIDDRYILDISRNAWNAAIEASLLAAASAPAAPMGMSVWEQVEGQIKKLLTA